MSRKTQETQAPDAEFKDAMEAGQAEPESASAPDVPSQDGPPLVYLGPSDFNRGLTRNMTFKAGRLPESLADLDGDPHFKVLLVAPDRLGAARSGLRDPGSRIARAFAALSETLKRKE